MKVCPPKWVKRANQWCITTVEKTSGMSSKHSIKQTQYWTSTKEEADSKYIELERGSK